jgi:hypothetical protein
MLNVIMVRVIMLSVIIPNAIMLSTIMRTVQEPAYSLSIQKSCKLKLADLA